MLRHARAHVRRSVDGPRGPSVVARPADNLPVTPVADPGSIMKKLLVLLILVMIGVAVARKLREA